MGSLKSGLGAIAFVSLVGVASVVGCTADGGSADITEPESAPIEEEAGKLPSPSAVDAGDAGDAATKKDAAPKPEAGVDAGPPPPVPGTACPDVTVVGKKPCGACGFAEALCEADAAGVKKWSEYGACGKELAGGCIPGTTVQEDCGNCGKVTKTCNQYCAYTTSTCAGQPVNNCKPGTVEYTTASCPTASTYKNRTCAATCTWGAYTATCEMPVNEIVLTIPAAVGATASQTITFSAAKVGSRIGTGTCPNSSPVAGDYPYQYVELKNASGQIATTTVYASLAPGGVVIDTVMAGYATAVQPMDDAAKKACKFGANDQSSGADVTALTGDSDFSILKTVTIPAGGSILVYVGAYTKTPTAANPNTGDLNINVRLDALN